MLSIVDALVRVLRQGWTYLARTLFAPLRRRTSDFSQANAFSYKMIKGRKPRLDEFISNQYFTYFSM